MPSPDLSAGHPRRRAILAALCAALLVMSVSVMAVTVALPAIARDLRATTGQLQWITESTVLALASLLMAMGALADRYGRRRILLGGLAVFAAASLLAALSRSPGQLVAARALLGAGNAMIMPATLSIVREVFPRDALPRAMAAWAGVASLGVVLGPLTGGLLVEHAGWRSLFLANVAAVAGAATAVALVVPASRAGAPRPLDVPGTLLLSGGFVALVYAVIEAPGHGPPAAVPPPAAGLAGAAVLAGVALRRRTAAQPLLERPPAGERAAPPAWTALTAAATGFFCLMGTLFLVTQYFQDVRGHSPSATALLLLPLAGGQLGMVPLTPRLAARFGLRRTMAGGLAVTALGLALASAAARSGQDGPLLVALALLAAGNAATVTTASTAVMAAAAGDRAGSAAALNETAFKLGGSLGVAVLGSVLAGHLARRLEPVTRALPPGAHASPSESISGVTAAARALGGPAGERLAATAREAFTEGFGRAALVAAAVALAAAAITAIPPGKGRNDDDR
ncbi:MFS transporter [Actinomadura rugatobispora]|uniref:MFS transporter n=1 Tax=Actinomadura rugatobispora TaxID=1994 RepID=A0ABW1A999_9ACTN